MDNCMYFCPARFRIDILWEPLREVPYWRRQALALFAHELVHAYQWLVVCRRDVLRWNELGDAERLPDRVQDIVLWMLGCGNLVRG